MSERSKNRPETMHQRMLDFSSRSLGSRNGLQTSSSGSWMGGPVTAVSINRSLLAPINLQIEPSIQTVRTNEMNQIKNLNNRFATVIDKVRLLEQQHEMLETKWKLMQDQTTGPSGIEPVFQTYISNLQKHLDQVKNDKVMLDLEKEKMYQDLEDFRKKYQDEISKRKTMENTFVLLKRDVDASFLSKLDLEKGASALLDDINFLKDLYKQDLIELQSSVKDTSVVVEMDNSRGLDMKQTIADFNSQYEDISAHSQRQAESWYKTKYDSLVSKAVQAAEKMHNTKAEIIELNRLISQLQNDILAVKKQNTALENQIIEVEAHGETVVKNAKTEINDLEAATQRAKWDMARQIREYQDLMNVKLALDMEISTYRKLLEGEENKFGQQSIIKISAIQPHYRMPETRIQLPTRSSPVVIKTVELKDSSTLYQ